jgi:hypothetical protein
LRLSARDLWRRCRCSTATADSPSSMHAGEGQCVAVGQCRRQASAYDAGDRWRLRSRVSTRLDRLRSGQLGRIRGFGIAGVSARCLVCQQVNTRVVSLFGLGEDRAQESSPIPSPQRSGTTKSRLKKQPPAMTGPVPSSPRRAVADAIPTTADSSMATGNHEAGPRKRARTWPTRTARLGHTP